MSEPTYNRLMDAMNDLHKMYRPVDVSAFLGVTSAVLGNWKSRGVPIEKMYDCAKKIGCTYEYLRHGTLPMVEVSPSSNMQTQYISAQSAPLLINLSEHQDLVSVPRVKFKLSAGVSGYAIEREDGNGKPVFFRQDWFSTNGYKPEKLFAVRVSGDSMQPSLWDGDLVVINTVDTEAHDGEAFAINYEGEMVIKRLSRDAGEWFATSDNADQRRFAPKRCTNDVVILGRVIYKQSERI